ncbi:hypothetical protein [Shimia sediminis]|uniref:hypothetical protein n=1 Tax=Shimia sediminis TaxID=2497945 RepID=UPI000F8C7D16|nr:hypothetical protein [Shimia sediminis]
MLQFLLLATVGLAGAILVGGGDSGDEPTDENIDELDEDKSELRDDWLESDEDNLPFMDVVGTDGDDDLVLDSEDFDGRISAIGGEGSDRFIVLPFDAIESDDEVVAELFDFDPDEDRLVIDTNNLTKHGFDIDGHISSVSLERDDDAGTTSILLDLKDEENQDEPVTKRVVVHSEKVIEQGDIEFYGWAEDDLNYTEFDELPLRTQFDPDFPTRIVIPTAPTFFVGAESDDEVSVNSPGHTVLTGAGNDLVGIETPIGGDETSVFTQSGDDTIVASGTDLGIWAGSGDDYINTVEASSEVTVQGGAGNDTIELSMGQRVHGGAGSNSYILHLDEDFPSNEPAHVTNLYDSSLEIRVPHEAIGDLEIENQFSASGHYLVRSIVTISGVEVAHIFGGMPEGEGGLSLDDPRITITSI